MNCSSQTYMISPRPPTLLRELAQGIASGMVFHSRMLEYEDEALLVFLPLSLMHESQRQRLLSANLGLIYEWKARAWPETSGEFLSCHYLNHEDAEQVLAWADNLHDANPPIQPLPCGLPAPSSAEFRVPSNDNELYETMFHAGDYLYSFVIARMTSAGWYSCAFSLCDQDGIPAHFGISQTGHQHQVFSRVVRLLHDWTTEHRPATLSFVAKEKNRERLYRRMAKRFATAWGYSAREERNAYGHTIFAFDRIVDAETHHSGGSILPSRARNKANALLSIAKGFRLTRKMTLREPDQSRSAE